MTNTFAAIEGKSQHKQYIRLSNELNRGTLLEFTFADREHHSNQLFPRNEESESDLVGIARSNSSMTERVSGLPGATSREQKLIVNQGHLARSWDVSQRSTAADWNEWLKRLKLDLLRESSSPALRACAVSTRHPRRRRSIPCGIRLMLERVSEQYQDSWGVLFRKHFDRQPFPGDLTDLT